MLARHRVILASCVSGIAVSAICACSGGAYSFVPSADGVSSADATSPVSVDPTADASAPSVRPETDGASSQSVVDVAHESTAVIDISVEPVRDASSSDVTSHPESAVPEASSPSLPLSGLLLWLSADVGVSEKDGHVAGWRDRSGNGNDARQLDEARRPTTDGDWHGGRPAISFDGVSAFLELPSSFNDFTGGLSWIVVGDAANDTRCPSFVHFSNGGENEDLSLHHDDGNTFVYEVANEYRGSGIDAAPANKPLFLEVIHTVSQGVTIFSGGRLSGQSNMMLPAAVPRAINHIGRSSYRDCDLLHGHVAEIMMYQRALEETERTAIEEYLRAKWSL